MWSLYAQSKGWEVIVLSYVDLALNVQRGNGYLLSISAEGYRLQESADRLLLVKQTSKFQSEHGVTPIAYYMPGYAYFIASIWTVLGNQDLAVVQITQVLLDGLLGPLLLLATLNACGFGRAGLIAAGLYAIALPIARFTVWPLPDSLTAVLTVCCLAALCIGFVKKRPVLGASVSGAMIGIAGWFRGDPVILVPLFALVILVFTNSSLATRVKSIAGLVLGWLVFALALTVFLYQVYGTWALTRPGVGLLLWEGIGQQPNPWKIQEPPGGSLDTAAGNLLSQRGLNYGYWEGDSFLAREFVDHLFEQPKWFAPVLLTRLVRVLRFRSPGTDWGWGSVPFLGWRLGPHIERIVIPLGILLSLVGYYRARHQPILVGACLAVLASRIVPFTFMRDEARFILPILVVYIIGSALGIYWIVERASQRYAKWKYKNEPLAIGSESML